MSKTTLYIHIVWATKHRQPTLTPIKEESVFRCATTLVNDMGYETIAINGMPDHVHLLIKSGAQLDLSSLMKQVKGVTSAMLNDMTLHAESFRWQEGYFAATVTPSHVPKIVSYIQNQKERHQEGATHSVWEETGEEVG